MNRSKIILMLILSFEIVALATIIYVSQPPKLGEITYGNITIDQARELIESNLSLVILDVRTDWEFKDGHLEGAINIPVDELEQKLTNLKLADEILVYCRTGNRSSNAVQILSNNGFTKLYHMNDGIEGWKQENYPLSKCMICLLEYQ